MNKRKLVITASIDALEWTLLTSLVGLIQVIAYITVANFDKKVNFSFLWIIENGSLISFCLAIIASIYFDFHFYKKHNKEISNIFFNNIIFKMFPWVIIFIVTSSTILGMTVRQIYINYENIANTQIVAISMSYIYTLYYKYGYYMAEIKNDF